MLGDKNSVESWEHLEKVNYLSIPQTNIHTDRQILVLNINYNKLLFGIYVILSSILSLSYIGQKRMYESEDQHGGWRGQNYGGNFSGECFQILTVTFSLLSFTLDNVCTV